MEQLIIKETILDILHNINRISTKNVPITSMGLFNGKMGMAIFFYHYGKYYNNVACVRIADDFIEDIRKNMIDITLIDYDNGLSGIDAGLKYLLKKGFIDASTARLPEATEQAIYNGLFNFQSNDPNDYLHRLSGLGIFFIQDSRRESLMTLAPSSSINRQGVSHIINLVGHIDESSISRLNYRDVLRIIDVFSQLFTTGFRSKDVRELLFYALQVLETIIFNGTNYKSFATSGNPYCIVLTLLQTYNRTGEQRFVTLAIRILKEFEGTASSLYKNKYIPNIDLLRHAMACKKLHTVLVDDYYNNCAQECLEIYRERKSGNNGASQYDNGNDYSLANGYTAEGMALLTLQGHVGFDWLEDLTQY